MRGFDDDRDATRFQRGFDGVRDLRRKRLLNLQALGEGVDDARQFADADNPACGQIGDVRAAENRHDMMLAMRLYADVAERDHFIIVAVSSNVVSSSACGSDV